MQTNTLLSQGTWTLHCYRQQPINRSCNAYQRRLTSQVTIVNDDPSHWRVTRGRFTYVITLLRFCTFVPKVREWMLIYRSSDTGIKLWSWDRGSVRVQTKMEIRFCIMGLANLECPLTHSKQREETPRPFSFIGRPKKHPYQRVQPQFCGNEIKVWRSRIMNACFLMTNFDVQSLQMPLYLNEKM